MKNDKLPFVLIAVGLLIFAGGAYKTHTMNKKVASINATLKDRQAVLAAKKRDSQTIVLKKAETPQQKNTQQQLQNVSDMKRITTAFFNVTMTFSSQKEWDNRAVKASAYATDNVLKNKNLFNSGKDSTGHSIINTIKEEMHFSSLQMGATTVGSDGTMTGIAEVSFSASTYGNDPANKTDVYQVKYDPQQHKVTDVQRIGELNTTSDEE